MAQTYHTLVTYRTVHVCFAKIKERVTVAPGDLLLAKAEAIMHHFCCKVQARATTNCAEGKCISVTTNGRSGKVIFYFSVGLYVWKNDTAMSEK